MSENRRQDTSIPEATPLPRQDQDRGPQSSHGTTLHIHRRPTITYLGNFPEEHDGANWTNKIQGVSHDENNWFFSNKVGIWKFPVDFDLSTDFGLDEVPPSVIFRGIPEPLIVDYNHFGDLDCWNGYLFVPITHFDIASSKKPAIVVFRADNLKFVGFSELPDLTETSAAAWCVIDPRNGLLYVPESTITSGNPIHAYHISVQEVTAGKGKVTLSPVPEFNIKIYDEQRGPLALAGGDKWMQGGAISRDGYLYISCGGDDDHRKDDGIHVFRIDHPSRVAIRVAKSSSGAGNPFDFEWHPGWSEYQEPEGLTIWELPKGKAPRISGNLHVIMNQQEVGTDALYFKHYDIISEPTSIVAPWIPVLLFD